MRLSITLALAGLAVLALNAESITADAARGVAESFFNTRPAARALRAAPLRLAHTAVNADGRADYYVFNRGDDEGFVVVGGDDRAKPVWGYATSGVFDADDAPEAMTWWLGEYRRELQWLREHPEAAPRRAVTLDTAVEPLLRTLWNQCKPFNDLCPTIPRGGEEAYGYRAPSGCVATAMAQIMYYYRWPDRGMGSHSYSCRVTYDNGRSYYTTLSANFSESIYDWENMAEVYYFDNKDYSTVMARSLDSESGAPATTAQQQTVARLMSDVGIAMDMSYGADGSGAYSESVAGVLATYFHYAQASMMKRDFYTGDWDARLRQELDQQRPIYYSGQAPRGGHAFVLDGYDRQGYFHVNWGWGGRSDGYFVSSLLNPDDQGAGGAEGGFNSSQSALVNLRPCNETRLSAAPSYIDFGTVQPGRSARGTTTLGGDLVIEPVTAVISGDDAQCFALERDTFDPGEVMLGATIAVVYTPIGNKDKHTATITVSGGGWDKTLSISLTGHANVAPQVVATPDTLDFATVAPGDAVRKAVALNGVNVSRDATLSLDGTCAECFKLSNITISLASLNRGTNVVVTYAPTTAGTHTALLTVRSGSATPARVLLTGTAADRTVTDGDINGDGQVDVDDVNALVNVILELKSPADYPGTAAMSSIDIEQVNRVVNIVLTK